MHGAVDDLYLHRMLVYAHEQKAHGQHIKFIRGTAKARKRETRLYQPFLIPLPTSIIYDDTEQLGSANT
jgi:hypothetical protein